MADEHTEKFELLLVRCNSGLVKVPLRAFEIEQYMKENVGKLMYILKYTKFIKTYLQTVVQVFISREILLCTLSSCHRKEVHSPRE